MDTDQNSNQAIERLHMLCYALLNISDLDSGGKLNVNFQNGIGVSLIQKIFELNKSEIITKRQGNSLIPLGEFTIYTQYFKNGEKCISVIIYLEEKEPSNPVNFPKLYFLSKKINKQILSNVPLSKIIKIFESAIEIPKTDRVIAVFIISSTGSPFVSKINKSRLNIAEHEVHIGGFISALMSFSNTIIGEETGAKLKEINFGNQHFYIISESDVIFAFLVESMNSLLQRYMYIIADEFLFDFRNYIKEFNGDVTPFNEFKKKINQYFII